MPVFIEGKPGTVAVVNVNDSLSVPLLTVSGAGGNASDVLGFSVHRSIITSFTEGDQTNQQFMHTLGRSLYVYSFGDRIGQLTVQGLSFASSCGEIGLENAKQTTHGLSLLTAWYRSHRLSASIEPLDIILGDSEPRQGYLISLQKSVADAATWLGRYTMTFAIPPQQDTAISGPQPGDNGSPFGLA